MRYLYYPGCSLEGSAREYDLATRALLEALGADLITLEDWSCCGASAAEAVSRLLALALPARNIALAEKAADADTILVPCSACYLNLKKVERQVARDPDLRKTLGKILAEEGLSLSGRIKVRHLLDVLSVDFGAEALRVLVKTPLGGLRIAPYYGCQCLRPYPVFDDPEKPRSMEPLIRAAGAEVFAWNMGGRCCGAAHMNTKREVALDLVAAILEAARGADAIATVCPMCQLNLEAYQRTASRAAGRDLRKTILYLPQLLGLALGLGQADLGLGLNLAVNREFRGRIAAAAPGRPAAATAR